MADDTTTGTCDDNNVAEQNDGVKYCPILRKNEAVVWKECLRVVATDDRLLRCEDSVRGPTSSSSSVATAAGHQRYDVSNWLNYLDAVEELIDDCCSSTSGSRNIRIRSGRDSRDRAGGGGDGGDDSNKATTIRTLRQLREFVGQRALRLLPRSYKLWKRQWEFLLDWEKKVSSSARRTDDRNNEDDAVNDGNSCDDDDDDDIEYLNRVAIPNAMKRSLYTLHAMPRPWIVYMEWMTTATATTRRNNKISSTEVRRTINRALQSVPVTQHDKLWPTILELAEKSLPTESRMRLLYRYCDLEPSYEPEYAGILARNEQWGASARAYYRILTQTDGGGGVGSATTTTGGGTDNDDTGGGEAGVGGDDNAWSAFVSVCSQHPVEVASASGGGGGGVPWESMVRAVLSNAGPSSTQAAAASSTTSSSQSSSQLLHGYLWSQIADSYVRQGMFDLARSVYEEGMQKVNTIRDFMVLYQAYLNLEEGLLQEAATMAAEAEDEEDGGDGERSRGGGGEVAAADPDDWDLLLSTPMSASLGVGGVGGAANSSSTSGGKLAQMEWSLARAEHLTERRPYLVNAVMLRQNPNDVKEWLRRSELFSSSSSDTEAGTGDADGTGRLRRAAQVLEKALTTVHANKAANGTLSDVVRRLVEVYEKGGEASLDRARDLLDRVCKQHTYQFYKADQLADCWVTWIEFELRHERWDSALALARESVAGGSGGNLNLTRSLRLWDLLLDLEESLGTTQTTKDAYNRALETKVATVQHVLNYSSFLTEHKYFEESFAAYEKGVSLFAFPHVGAKLLWKEYLQAFLKRYKGTKIERTRDLFERCIESCPAETVGEFYIMNGSFEEEYGLVKRALSVYQSMCDKVPKEEKLTAYKLWIVKTTKYLGLTSTRDIYQNALEKLDDPSAASLCLDFVKMETSLHEIDRARAILNYGAQMADPRRLPEYWKAWNEFEIGHGNEETFREMLRVKRSVEAAFSTVINYNATGGTGAGDNNKGGSSKKGTLTEEEAMRMIANQEGVDLDKERRSAAQTTTIAGFVPSSSKRPAASLDDVEERVAKLRKATGAAEKEADVNRPGESMEGGDGEDDDDEIDIDDIDAEIEQAAAEGEAAAAAEESTAKEATQSNDTGSSTKAGAVSATTIKDVSTKAIPAAVLGGLKKS